MVNQAVAAVGEAEGDEEPVNKVVKTVRSLFVFLLIITHSYIF